MFSPMLIVMGLFLLMLAYMRLRLLLKFQWWMKIKKLLT